MVIPKYRTELKFLIFILVLSLFWYLGRYMKVDTTLLQDSLAQLPIFVSALLYVVLYITVTFFIFFSKDIFWFIGALLFGPFLSASLICIAELTNAVILFHLSRFLGRGYVEKRLSDKYRTLDRKLSGLNLFWLLVFRAAPLVPYRFMDLAAGLTGIRFRKYFVAVFFGTPLKMFWIQYIIYAVGKSIINNPFALMEYFLGNRTLFLFSFLYVILVVMVVIKMVKREKRG